MRLAAVCIAFIILLVFHIPGQAQDEALAMEIIARVNAWRIREGVWPLKPNDTLKNMALQQAQYIASLPALPDDLHVDGRGLRPRERALLTPFNWPYYELPGQIAIGENAALGTPDYALEFWQESALHARTALNPAYREVGVAALPYRNTILFIVVFGARPDVLPALVDPRDGRTIYLTNERFEYARFHDSMQVATKIQVFDSVGRPIYDEPIDWTQRISVPVEAGDAVYILSSDGEHSVISPVDLSRDRAILPVATVPTEAPVVTTEAAPEIAATPTTAPVIQPTMTPVVVATDLVPQPDEQPDLLILYSNDTLDVLNVSGATADWRTLAFHGTIDFPFTHFTRVTQFPLEALPNRHCLQIRSQTISGDVVKQENCSWVRSLITVSPDRLFWAQGPFEVQHNGLTITTCEPGAGVCVVDLP
ncbi:MAG TPA: CAP domain-containing protein [Spirillospora sp.]|nr:CAP domain-containing protein [Spirillospora sp.]